MSIHCICFFSKRVFPNGKIECMFGKCVSTSEKQYSNTWDIFLSLYQLLKKTRIISSSHRKPNLTKLLVFVHKIINGHYICVIKILLFIMYGLFCVTQMISTAYLSRSDIFSGSSVYSTCDVDKVEKWFMSIQTLPFQCSSKQQQSDCIGSHMTDGNIEYSYQTLWYNLLLDLSNGNATQWFG